MTDTRTRAQRSAIMRAVGGKNTGPELAVRSLLHGMGYRFGTHRKDLPGSPDIVLVGRKRVVFVHGCFWHAHHCRYGRPAKSRRAFWNEKRSGNRRRDVRNRRDLRKLGWRAITVWQCQLKKPEWLRTRLRVFLEDSNVC